ncbi:FG-GAP-like repeat-containing protein [Uniformispora flossi]|uniref:C40 family peptidase n=1 Tax=Uniformispora flossi TaxID=3390723 RepID=UPI003C2E977B
MEEINRKTGAGSLVASALIAASLSLASPGAVYAATASGNSSTGAGQGPVQPVRQPSAATADAPRASVQFRNAPDGVVNTLDVATPTVSRSEIISRAKVWTDAAVPYNQSAYRDGYRTDCSGFVSMAWKLGASLTTDTLPTVAHPIGKEELKPGDVLLNTATGDDGHVVIFESWVNEAHTAYSGYEEAGGSTHKAVHRNIDYPYFSGHGTFTPYRYNNVQAGRTNDFNGDGRADLIALNPDGSISVGTNFGDGWSGYQGVSSGWGPYTDRLDFADFNNDGLADLIALNPDGTISVGLNMGNGNGWSGYHEVSSGWGTYEGRLKFADLNNDGKADLIALNEDGSIDVGINFGDGWSNYHGVSSGWGTYKGRLNFADLNDDGKADLIALNADGSLTVGINFGDGWSNYHGVSSGWGTYEDRLDFADLDGDGKADLIALNEDGSISVGINFGDGWSNYHGVSSGWGPYKGRINFA